MTFTVPLSTTAHQQAQHLRQLQASPRKAKQVYLNTLAVYAVNYYLQYLGIATDLEASDSQDRVQVSLQDVADLVVPSLGRLECRFVLPDANTLHIPQEVWADRIGCVAVRLDADLSTATLLGFVPEVTTVEVPVTELRSLSDLLLHLESLQQRAVVSLNQWFSAVAETSWKTVEAIAHDVADLLGGPPINFAYRQQPAAQLLSDLDPDITTAIPALLDLLHTRRDKWTRLQVLDLLGNVAVGNAEAISSLSKFLTTTQDDDLYRQAAVSLGKISPNHPKAAVRRARLLELGMQLHQQRVVLVMTLLRDESDGVDVHVRLYPVNGAILPAGLHLSILDDLGDAFLQEQAAGHDGWMQLQFSGSAGDRFILRVSLDGTQVSEEFVI